MRRGHERLIEMVENFGLMTLSETIRTVLENDEERMRNRIDDLPDGRYEAIDHLDGDGVTEGLVPIRVELVVDGDEIEVDFAGTAEQVKTSINCPVSATEAAVHYAVKVTLDPGDPGTLGAYRPISVSAPEGSLLNPRYPAPVTIGSHETCTRVYDVTLRAIAEIDARLAYSAGEGSSNVLIYESLESGKFNYTSMAGGMGACFNRDGVNAIRSGVGNTGPQPIERVEEEYDYVHFESFSIVPDSGGAGEHRGGATTRRVLRVDDETRITTATDRTKTQPFGLAGGDPGAAARHVHVAPDGEETVLDAKSTTIVSPGSRIILQPAGGGGYGLPENRPRETVLADVRDGYISPEAAALEYDIDVNDEDGDTY